MAVVSAAATKRARARMVPTLASMQCACVYRSAARAHAQRLAQTLLCCGRGYSGAVRLAVAAPRTNNAILIAVAVETQRMARPGAARLAARQRLVRAGCGAPVKRKESVRAASRAQRIAPARRQRSTRLQTGGFRWEACGHARLCHSCAWSGHKPTSAKTKRSCGLQHSRTSAGKRISLEGQPRAAGRRNKTRLPTKTLLTEQRTHGRTAAARIVKHSSPRHSRTMRAVALALALTRSRSRQAGTAGMATLAPTPISEFSCAFMKEDEDSLMFDWERTQEMVHAWGGFPQCEHLRCDAATGALWLNVQREKVHTFRQKSSKGHTKVTRSYCMVLTPDGRYARYARGEYKRREERWMWREREKVSWKDVPHVNGTLAPDAGFGKKMYDACLHSAPCAGAGRPRRLPCFVKSFVRFRCRRHASARRLLRRGPEVLVPLRLGHDGARFLIFYLALSILGVWTLACCVSNRCCYAFGTLQKIRNEFADLAGHPCHLSQQAMRRAVQVGCEVVLLLLHVL